MLQKYYDDSKIQFIMCKTLFKLHMANTGLHGLLLANRLFHCYPLNFFVYIFLKKSSFFVCVTQRFLMLCLCPPKSEKLLQVTK